jgi:hypothetical protein
MGKTDDEVMHEIYEWTWDEMGVSDTKERDEVAKRTSVIVNDVIKNNKDDMTFDDMIDQLKGKIEEYKDKDGNDMEPIDAPIQPPVDHGAIVQGFLTDPDSKLILRKDDTADKMLSRTKFTNKNTMLSSILSDIASRLLTKSGEEDRVANFASRVADEMEQENSATFKPTPDYIKNKKIAVQLAKRYIDDYKKMQSDPAYKDEIRMEPGAFNPKKDLKGKAKETEAFESWVDNITEQKPYVSMYKDDKGKMVYDVLDKDGKSAFKSSEEKVATDYLHKNFDKLKEGNVEEYAKEPKDEKDKAEKLKAIHDLEMDPKLKDPESIEAIKKRKAELMKSEDAGEKIANMAQNMTRDEFMSHADELGLSPEEAAEHYEKMSGGAHAGKFEGNQFAQAVNKAKAAGMKSGDKFKVGDKEYTLKDAIELAGLQLEEFFSEEDAGEQALANEIAKMYDYAYEFINDSSDNPSDIESDYKFGYNDDDNMEAIDLAAAFRKDFKTGMALQKQLQAQREKEGREGDWDPFNPESMQHDELKALMSKNKGESVSEDPELARIKNLAFYQ